MGAQDIQGIPEQAFVFQLALAVWQGQQSLDEARRKVVHHDCKPKDFDDINAVSETVRRLFNRNSSNAYVLAILNYEIAKIEGIERHCAPAAFDLAMCMTETGKPEEAIPLFEELLRLLVDHELPRVARAWVIGNLAGARAKMGDFEAAERGYRAAAERYQQDRDRSGEAHCLLNCASMLRNQNKFDLALSDLQKAEEISTETDNTSLSAEVAMALGRVHHALGHYDEAIAMCQKAGQLSIAVNAPGLGIEALELGANCLTLRKELDKAIFALEKAIDIHRQTAAAPDYDQLLTELLHLYSCTGRHQEALRCCEEACQSYQSSGKRDKEAVWVCQLANLHAAAKENKSAVACFERALYLYRELGDSEHAGSCLSALGLLSMSSGDTAQAIQYFGDALSSMGEQAQPSETMEVLFRLGNALYTSGDHDAAIDTLRRAVDIGEVLEDRTLLPTIVFTLGAWLLKTRGAKEAVLYLERTSVLAMSSGERILQAHADVILGDAYLGLGRMTQAQDRLESAATIFSGVRMEKEEAMARCGLADAEIGLGQTGKAYEDLTRVLEDKRTIGEPMIRATALSSPWCKWLPLRSRLWWSSVM